MTRANVWKYMKELRESGFEIESATKKGYILKSVGMHLTEDTIYYHFKKQNFVKNILFFPRIDSTNDFLKYNREEIPDCTLVVSTFQTKDGILYDSMCIRDRHDSTLFYTISDCRIKRRRKSQKTYFI